MNIDLPVDHARTLLAVVDGGTLDAAAAALHVTPSAVSQRIKALEQRTGRVLLIRSKPVQLTESGQVVVRFARQLARMEQDVAGELGMSGSGVTSTLPIAVNADSLSTWFVPALAQVGDQARICFELHRADEGHTTALLREGRVMAAVTSTPDPVQGCSVRKLGHMRYLACVAPSRMGERSLAQVLDEVPVLIFDKHDDLQDAFARKLTRGRGAGGPRHFVPSSEGFVDAIVVGLGWGMVPRVQAAPLLRSGAVVDIAPDRGVDVPLYWQQWKLDSPALAAVAQAVRASAAAELA
ncbi:LysR family transcriptional regulator ArgP [Saccharopolyspora dendranthemae]|uniref:HTH-type transcriptional regulator LysG n=1 Tax=Saccharopolyspora dendranthemae TaxID=1181886 RepID=A0A561V719_9PSEU|nr:LysR family transcriptional regulator ArgP [Saccharopolyspora dendranthemae]TWG07400.1 LysR family transcriptional regulator (chromosome initiation inhibitor) [Saccharopolyspora dendranthemae]